MEDAFEAEFVSLHVRAYSNRAAFSLYTGTLGFEVRGREGAGTGWTVQATSSQC